MAIQGKIGRGYYGSENCIDTNYVNWKGWEQRQLQGNDWFSRKDNYLLPWKRMEKLDYFQLVRNWREGQLKEDIERSWLFHEFFLINSQVYLTQLNSTELRVIMIIVVPSKNRKNRKSGIN